MSMHSKRYLSAPRSHRPILFDTTPRLTHRRPKVNRSAGSKAQFTAPPTYEQPSSVKAPQRPSEFRGSENKPHDGIDVSNDTAQLITSNTRGSARAAFLGAWIASFCTCYYVLSAQDLPPVPSWLFPLSVAVPCGAAATAAILKVVLGDLFHLELHDWRVYVQLGVPSKGAPIPQGAVQVRATGDVRGNGAYAVERIRKGSLICQYDGELLSRQQYKQRYPDNKSDYVICIDDEWALDASRLVADTSRFSAVHMNHSRLRANVLRYTNCKERRVCFFAARDIQPGEELLFDYGRNYWRSREHLELP